MTENKILVLPNDEGIRPAGKPDECFYCNQKVGTPHSYDCVCLQHKARISITFKDVDLFMSGHEESLMKYSAEERYFVQLNILEQLWKIINKNEVFINVECTVHEVFPIVIRTTEKE